MFQYREPYDVGDIFDRMRCEREYLATLEKENAAKFANQKDDARKAEQLAIAALKHNNAMQCAHGDRVYTLKKDEATGEEWIDIQPEDPIPRAYGMAMPPEARPEKTQENPVLSC